MGLTLVDQTTGQAMAHWRQFRPRPFDASQGIALGALVCLVDADGQQQHLLLGKGEEDEVSMQVGGTQQQFGVLWVK